MDKSDETIKTMFVQVLGIDLEAATILVNNGITSLEEVAYVPLSELVSIKGLQEPQLQAWRKRAREHLLVSAIGDGDDGEPQPAVVLPPSNPMAGGSGAQVEDKDKK
jgi:N utilization substance protein A